MTIDEAIDKAKLIISHNDVQTDYSGELRDMLLTLIWHIDTQQKQFEKEKAERDKMRCEDCKYCITHRQNNDMTCDNVSGLVFLKPNHFCSHFEPKENENG